MSEADKFTAWVKILMSVNHEPKKILIKNQLFECNRGESLMSLESWAKLFGKGWNRFKVKRFFDLLKNDHMIVTKNEQKTLRLTVCNYDLYQNQCNDNATIMQRSCNDNATITLTNKNDKELIKNEKNIYTSSEDDLNPLLQQETFKIEVQKIPYSEIVKLFNETCHSLSKVQIISEQRKKKIKSRWNQSKDYQSLSFWEDYFQKVQKSDFLSGRSTEWTASFDWLLEPKNFTKVIEGNYENKGGDLPW